MKRKISVTLNGKTITNEVEVRNLDHFNVQLTNKAHVFKAKKGKGSYTRKQKHTNLEER